MMPTPETNPLDKWATPQEVTELDLAFAARGDELTPTYEDLPEEFRRGNMYTKFTSRHFFGMDTGLDISVKPGIDHNTAVRHMNVVLSTFSTKHEHKIAGAGYLFSLWFDLTPVETVENNEPR